MSKTGRHIIYKLDFKSGKMIPESVVEPISPSPERGGDWGKTGDLSNRPISGAIKEEDSIITEVNGFKNITYK